jgi:hypothetical protein
VFNFYTQRSNHLLSVLLHSAKVMHHQSTPLKRFYLIGWKRFTPITPPSLSDKVEHRSLISLLAFSCLLRAAGSVSAQSKDDSTRPPRAVAGSKLSRASAATRGIRGAHDNSMHSGAATTLTTTRQWHPLQRPLGAPATRGTCGGVSTRGTRDRRRGHHGEIVRRVPHRYSEK